MILNIKNFYKSLKYKDLKKSKNKLTICPSICYNIIEKRKKEV